MDASGLKVRSNKGYATENFSFEAPTGFKMPPMNELGWSPGVLHLKFFRPDLPVLGVRLAHALCCSIKTEIFLQQF